jgi:hypothetical protein
MKRFSLGVLVVLFAGLMAGTALAASLDKLMTVNVPFAFLVGKDSMPAGEYEVLGQFNTHLIWIKSPNGAKVSISRAIPNREKKAVSGAALVFTRYGDDYFLSKVLVAGQDAKVLPKSPREVERERLAKGGNAGGVQVVAATR